MPAFSRSARPRPLAIALSLALLPACRSSAGEAPPLDLDRVFELSRELQLSRDVHRGWFGDGGEYLAIEGDGDDGERRLVVVSPEGDAQELFDRRAFESAFAALPGVEAEQAERWSGRTSFDFGPNQERVMFNAAGDLFGYDLARRRAVRLTSDPDAPEVGESFSPDGQHVAFVRDHDLWVVDVDGASERALTEGGDENHLHGRLDWVYQEELYGRGNFGAYWWSPDSSRIALLVLDETEVPEYTIVDHRKVRPDKESWRYPKAGDPNPTVRLAVVDVDGGPMRFIDLSDYAGEEHLLVRVGWTPDSRRVVVQVQNRIQTWLDLVLADPVGGGTERLFRDETGVWIEPDDGPWWIDGGERFVWRSERDGYAHLYLYGRDGRQQRRLTSGAWEVDQVHGIDEERGVVWFNGDRDDVKGNQLFRVGLDGANLTRVTEGAGTHSVSMAPGLATFVDRYSSISEAPRATLRRANGELVRTLDEVDGAIAREAGLVTPEFFQVPTRDGFPMEAVMIKPAGWTPNERYPVFVHTYAGPHAPQVRDRFSGRGSVFHQMLAQEGYLVWICDNRSASGKGLESVKGIYKNLGAQELRDIEDGLDWLVAQGYADPERIAISGWSYGGYMAAYALTHSKRFKIGLVGAPVTDWRHYDSIYTERYMDTPQANPEGYAQSSAIEAAADLHGRALLMHGEIDENVHAQNTYRFAEALQNAGKSFEMMIYPGNRHGIVRPAQRKHLYQTMAEFVRRNL